MLSLLNRLLKIEIVILILLGGGIAIYTAADAIKISSQDLNQKKEVIQQQIER